MMDSILRSIARSNLRAHAFSNVKAFGINSLFGHSANHHQQSNRFFATTLDSSAPQPFELISKDEGNRRGLQWVKDANLWDRMTKKKQEIRSDPSFELANIELEEVQMVGISYTQTRNDQGDWVAHTLLQETMDELRGVRWLHDQNVLGVSLLDTDRWADYGLLAYMTGHVRTVPTMLSDHLLYGEDTGRVTIGGRPLMVDRWIVDYLEIRNARRDVDRQLSTSDVVSLAAWMRIWPVAERIVGSAYGDVSMTVTALEKLITTLEVIQEAATEMKNEKYPRTEYWAVNLEGMPSYVTLDRIVRRIAQTSKVSKMPPGSDQKLKERAMALGLIAERNTRLPSVLRALCSDTFMNCASFFEGDKFRIIATITSQLTGVGKDVARRIVGKDVRAQVDLGSQMSGSQQQKQETAAKHHLCEATTGIRNIFYNGHRAADGDCFPTATFVPPLTLSVTSSILPDDQTKRAFSEQRLEKAWKKFDLATMLALVKDRTFPDTNYKLVHCEQKEDGWLPHEPFGYKAVYLRAESMVEDKVLVDLILCTMHGHVACSVETHIRIYGESKDEFLPLLRASPMAGVTCGQPKLQLRKVYSRQSVQQSPSQLVEALQVSNPVLADTTLGQIAASKAWHQPKQRIWTGYAAIDVEVYAEDDRGVEPLIVAHVPFAKDGKFDIVEPVLRAK